MKKSITIYHTIPVEVVTPKIAPNRQDSIFYTGKDIARVKTRNREYVLTTAGEYQFQLAEKGKVIQGSSLFIANANPVVAPSENLSKNILGKLTDAKIRRLNRDDLIQNWGWFGINVWENGKCLDYPTDTYSYYDEAMDEFKDYVKKDIESRI